MNGRTHHQGMNMAPVKETEYLRQKVHDYNKLPTNDRNLESDSISTRADLKESKQEMQFLGISEQHEAEDPIANLYKLDIAKYMYTLVMIDRQSKIKTVYLEIDEATKDVIHLVPSYGRDVWKNEKAIRTSTTF